MKVRGSPTAFQPQPNSSEPLVMLGLIDVISQSECCRLRVSHGRQPFIGFQQT